MNSQVIQKNSLPFGIDLDDDVTVKLWSDGSVTFIRDRGIGDDDEVPISKDGVAKLVAWLNKHAVEQPLAPDASPESAKMIDSINETVGHLVDIGAIQRR